MMSVPLQSRFRRTVTLAAIALGCVASKPEVLAQLYGLDSRAPIGPYLNNVMPDDMSGSGSWVAVPAFPNLTFEDPTFLTHEPRTNRLYVGGRQGLIWWFVNQSNATTKSVFLDLRARTQGWGDCGLLGLAFHPDYNLVTSTNRRYVYIYYSYTPNPVPGPNQPPGETPTFNRLSRFTVPEGSLAADPNSELVLINQYDRHVWHNGGALFFGNDGYLYLCIGDAGGMSDQYDTTQKIDEGLRSGVFRIDVNKDLSKSHPIRRQPISSGPGDPPSFTGNYYIPNDNPFLDPAGTVLEEFWALGLRSPHRMTFDPVTQRIWLGDVGQDYWEEINVIEETGNYQWAFRDGSHPGPKPAPNPIIGISRPPVYEYPHEDGDNCVIGGYVYRGPEHAVDLGGKYIFGDNGSGRIWAMTYDGINPPTVTFLCSLPPSTTYIGLSSFGLDANGELYMCKMGAEGMIYKLGRTDPPPPPPATLSQTGAFSDLASLTPAPGLIPYDLNVPFWSDRAAKRRWIAVPNDGAPYSTNETVAFAPTGEWAFPDGTVFVKHFDLPVDDTNPSITRRLETRLLVRYIDGAVYGLTYKWRADNSDADLLTSSLNEDIPIQTTNGVRFQTWYYPSPQDCLTCHNDVGVLGPKTRQLNGDFTYPTTGRTDNQLRTWNHVGLMNPPINETNIPAYDKLARVDDLSASLEHRVRSYLDANCMQCHRPSGVPANFDARFDTPLVSQGIIDGAVNDPLGVPGAKAVAPGSVPQSLMHLRMNSTNPAVMMPPLARHLVDTQALAVLAQWINILPPGGSLPMPWTSHDVGAVAVPGYAAFSNGVFIVTGSGDDIWNAADEFHFVHQPMTGDGEIIAQVTGVQNTDGWAKAGVMIRESLNAGAPYAMMLVTAANGSRFQWRPAAGGLTSDLAGPFATAPYWVRLTRQGNVFTASVSPDGSGWTTVGSQTLALPNTLYVGLAVSAHSNGVLNTSTFDTVQLTSSAPASLPPPWLNQDVGSVTAAGNAAYSNGVFDVSGSGADIWYTADEFHFVYRMMTNDCRITARVDAVQNTDPWAKGGVMMRESLDAGARCAMAAVTAGNGSGYQWRSLPNGTSDGVDGPFASAPYWVRLVRSGNSFTAYASADGANWTLIHSEPIDMASVVYVGLAVTSRSDGALNTSTFSNVQLSGDPTPKLTVVEFDDQGSFLLRVEGDIGRTYDIEVSSDLFFWTNFMTIENFDGPTLIIDSNAANHPRQFYRAILQE